MRKRIVPTKQETGAEPNGDWLNLTDLAEVEITSEDPDYPVENALLPGKLSGWRAAGSGEQTIRLLFAEPQNLRRIWVHFEELSVERTHQFVLRWSPDNGATFKNVVRQEWTFSPKGMREETENIYLDLPGVTVLELIITPDISGGEARASLAQLRVG
jgi:hypothetical protein